MFIDNPTIPVQLEVVLDLLQVLRQKSAQPLTVATLLQPTGLPGLTEKSRQAEAHLSAAQELGLVTKDADGHLRLAYTVRSERPTPRDAILDAFDRIVLGSAAVEPWFGRFYGYVIAQPRDFIPARQEERTALASAFNNALPDHIERSNVLNRDKILGYLRWYTYAGMGWFDPDKRFVPDPTQCLRRALPRIFTAQRLMEASAFMSGLAQACPELDGGTLFMESASRYYDPAERSCTRALAVALRNLHDEGLIRLECPKDSVGWGLERAGSVRVPGILDSDRFDRVALLDNR